MSGVDVYIDALKGESHAVGDTAAGWGAAKDAAGKQKIDRETLGIIGGGVIPTIFNATIDVLVGQLAKGQASIQNASGLLAQAAATYEAKDEQYWREIGAIY